MRSRRYATLTAILWAITLTTFADPAETLRRLIPPALKELEATDIRMGISIEDLDGKRLYGNRVNESFVLASNAKLFTTAAALTTLPQDFRWRTSAFLDGDRLWVVGGGDGLFYTVGGVSYPAKFLDEITARLKNRRQTALAELVVDARYFDSEYQHPLWPQDQLREAYSAPVCGLPYERGMVRVQTSNGTREEATSTPLDVVTAFLLDGLRARGIAFEKGSRFPAPDEPPPDPSTTLYVQESAFTLKQTVAQINTFSDNYLAEHLFKTLGVVAAHDGSFEGGARAVIAALKRMKIPLDGYSQVDGSGLGRTPGGGSRCTPITMNALLRRMLRDPVNVRAFFDSLPISGETGTLRRRFGDAPFQGHVFAKTGYINGALTLSGYMIGESNRGVTFCLLGNDDVVSAERLERIRRFQLVALTALWLALMDRPPDVAVNPTTDAATTPTASSADPTSQGSAP
jgi:D-alanyl-D-alanine carboxypeptidase/D-alanyl-D-alanine-endopeptidase (penicillin-binding protein 4)